MIIAIEQAHLSYCEQMSSLINQNAVKEIMLPKGPHELTEVIDRFFVALCDGQFAGCCGYKVCVNRWVEIISLVRKDEYRGHNIGSQLIAACLNRARSYGFTKIFTMTQPKRKPLFAEFGFVEVSIKELPHKVWTDCVKCPRNAAGPGDSKCGEIALVIEA